MVKPSGIGNRSADTFEFWTDAMSGEHLSITFSGLARHESAPGSGSKKS